MGGFPPARLLTADYAHEVATTGKREARDLLSSSGRGAFWETSRKGGFPRAHGLSDGERGGSSSTVVQGTALNWTQRPRAKRGTPVQISVQGGSIGGIPRCQPLWASAHLKGNCCIENKKNMSPARGRC